MATNATIDAGQQHLKALRHANRVRLARAEMKRKVAAGEVQVADVIRTSPWQAQRMEISELLMSQKRWGRARCRRLLLSIGVRENKPIGTLTERQRVALCRVLEARPRATPALRCPPRPSLRRPARPGSRLTGYSPPFDVPRRPGSHPPGRRFLVPSP
jgi:hypothetical protein